MSNTSSDKASNVPVGQPPISPAANAASPDREEPQAKPSAPINLNSATTLHKPGQSFDERSNPPREAGSVVNTKHDGPREFTVGVNPPSVRNQASHETKGEAGQTNVPVPSSSPTARPSEVAPKSTNPADEELALSQPAGPTEVTTEAGGAVPPGRPPASVLASSPEEPKPRPSDGAPPPLLDVEEFIREAEDRKRGAKTMREIKALAEYIREIRERGIPVASIHAGLKEKGLVTCSRSRFDEICAELLPDLFEPKRRRNA